MTRWQKFTLFILSAATVFVWYTIFQESREGLTVYFFDVGQGDSIFIQTENGNQIVIDGGPDDTVLAQIGNVMPFYDRTIDLLVLTHPDADHLNGLVEILGRYKIKQILTTGVLHDTAQYFEWEKQIMEYGIPVLYATAGQTFQAEEGVVFEVLAPFRELAGINSNKVNDTSIVLRMDYGETSFLFPGDIESKTERMLAILASGAIDVDILKVAHHGSKTSSSEEFLKAVTPEIAVISAGRNNKFGHPHSDVLARYEERMIPVYRTDTNGTVVFRCKTRACVVQ